MVGFLNRLPGEGSVTSHCLGGLVPQLTSKGGLGNQQTSGWVAASAEAKFIVRQSLQSKQPRLITGVAPRLGRG